jgi:hypothetical protein
MAIGHSCFRPTGAARKMTAPRYRSISVVGNRVTVVTRRTSAGSAPAPASSVLARGRRSTSEILAFANASMLTSIVDALASSRGCRGATSCSARAKSSCPCSKSPQGRERLVIFESQPYPHGHGDDSLCPCIDVGFPFSQPRRARAQACRSSASADRSAPTTPRPTSAFIAGSASMGVALPDLAPGHRIPPRMGREVMLPTRSIGRWNGDPSFNRSHAQKIGLFHVTC